MEKYYSKNMTAVVFEDHKLVASTFAMLLERTGHFSSVHTFDDPHQILDFFVQHAPANALVFMDYFIPECNTLHLMNDIRRFCPRTRIVMVSSVENPTLIKKICSNNIDGFISKTDGAEEIISCLRALPEKRPYLSTKIQEILNSGDHERSILDFTPREMEILTYLSLSRSVEQISEQLSLSKHTVITHRRNLLSKSGCNSIAELIAYALRAELIPRK
nr:response regulator transcription factor [uncultured Dyadobacter sp.]